MGLGNTQTDSGRRHSLFPVTLPGCLAVNWYLHTMPISPELLEILICPACRGNLDLKADSSGLRCQQCHRLYPIRDDIPIMLIDEATIEE